MNRLRLMRYERGLTQRDVAETIGITPSFLSLIEKDKAGPGPGTARALADFYEITVAEVLEATARLEREAA